MRLWSDTDGYVSKRLLRDQWHARTMLPSLTPLVALLRACR